MPMGFGLAGARVAVDCLDTLAARYTLETACRELGLPYVHGSVAGLEGLIMTVMPGDPGLRGLYGPEPVAKENSAEVLMGVPTMTPALVAGLQVNEVVKLLLERRPLQRRMLHLDLESPSLEVLELG
jgi:molybdopterin/thiamine biosynthesis adenylyltransferase